MNEMQLYRAHAARLGGLTLEKDFFSLDEEEARMLYRFWIICGKPGANNLGRSKTRQFYYYLQDGYKKLNKGAK